MAAKWSGRARIAGMARSYEELLQAAGNWDMTIKKRQLMSCRFLSCEHLAQSRVLAQDTARAKPRLA